MIASHIKLSIPDKQALLATLDPVGGSKGLGTSCKVTLEVSYGSIASVRRAAAHFRSAPINGHRLDRPGWSFVH